MRSSKGTGLEGLNTYVVIAYAVFAMMCVMAAFEPVLVLISFCSFISLNFLMEGWRSALRSLRWQLFVIAVFAVMNCIFIGSGKTVLSTIGPIELHLESLVYGAVAGTMVVCAMSCFASLSKVVSSDEALMVTGGRLPVVSLMASMAIRLIPRFKGQSTELGHVRKACTCANLPTGKPPHRLASSLLTHLLAMSLEDSLVCADSMRSRGWGSAPKRSLYNRIKTTRADAIAIVAVVALGAVCLIFAFEAAASFQFYPVMAFDWSGLLADEADSLARALSGSFDAPGIVAAFYVLYAVFFFLPHIALIAEEAKWRP